MKTTNTKWIVILKSLLGSYKSGFKVIDVKYFEISHGNECLQADRHCDCDLTVEHILSECGGCVEEVRQRYYYAENLQLFQEICI